VQPGLPPAAHRLPATATPGRESAALAARDDSLERRSVWTPNGIQRRTGEHMVRSRAVSPHAITVVEVGYDNVVKTKTAHADAFRAQEGFSLTYLPFIARAVIDAARTYPRINATMGDASDATVHEDVNLAIAVDLNHEGLLAPVVKTASDYRLRALARRINDSARRARAGEVGVDDLQGGTFTISNSGTFGTHMVLPIINQPQVAILSTDGIARKPVVRQTGDGDEYLTAGWVGMLAMAWDHRAIDGAYAAQFLAEVRTILETRDWETEL